MGSVLVTILYICIAWFFCLSSMCVLRLPIVIFCLSSFYLLQLSIVVFCLSSFCFLRLSYFFFCLSSLCVLRMFIVFCLSSFCVLRSSYLFLLSVFVVCLATVHWCILSVIVLCLATLHCFFFVCHRCVSCNCPLVFPFHAFDSYPTYKAVMGMLFSEINRFGLIMRCLKFSG